MKMMHHAAAAFMCGFLWSFAPAAVAQVPKDRLDQAARCGFYLSFRMPEMNTDLALTMAVQNIPESKHAIVFLRISELVDIINALPDADQERAVREAVKTWRPNCVAVGVLGGDK